VTEMLLCLSAECFRHKIQGAGKLGQSKLGLGKVGLGKLGSGKVGR